MTATTLYRTRREPRPNGSGDSLVVEGVEVAGVLQPGEHDSAPDGISIAQLDAMVAHAAAQAERGWYPPVIVGNHGQASPARVGDVRNLRRDGDWLLADLFINDWDTEARILNDTLVSRSFEGALYADGDAEFEALALTDGVPGHFDYAWPPMRVAIPDTTNDVRASAWQARRMGLARVRLSRSNTMAEDKTAAPKLADTPPVADQADIMAELAKLSERLAKLENGYDPAQEKAGDDDERDDMEMAKSPALAAVNKRLAEVEAQNVQLRRERDLDGQSDRVALATGMKRSDARVLLSKHNDVAVAASNFIECVKLARESGPPATDDSTPPLNLKPSSPADVQKALLAKAEEVAKVEKISLAAARAKVARESMLKGGV